MPCTRWCRTSTKPCGDRHMLPFTYAAQVRARGWSGNGGSDWVMCTQAVYKCTSRE